MKDTEWIRQRIHGGSGRGSMEAKGRDPEEMDVEPGGSIWNDHFAFVVSKSLSFAHPSVEFIVVVVS
jgi:hypothetical protein